MDIIIVSGGAVLCGLLKEISERSDCNERYIIAADKGLESCYRAGIMPDKIIGDFDSVNNEILDKYTDESRFIRLTPHKDYTDTHVALEYAIDIWQKYGSCNQDKVLIYGATGTRLDHTLANIGLLSKLAEKGIEGRIIDENNRIRMITGDTEIEKDNKYPFISLIPFSDYVRDVRLTGFEYSGEHIDFIQGESLGVSNSIVSDKGRIEYKEGMLLVLESRD